ncbi:MAG TPA: winged helix-turn-helix domain-containing protein [Thermoplasmata archaeon]|nr:winged helix-turn-helix domain-containing protein [Thermoplasmata archaeon]
MSAALRQLLWYLIAGTRGGVNRARILEALHERPANAHQLCESLGLDYRTVRHHLGLLERNGLLTRPAGDAYAAPYFLSSILEANYADFEEVRRHIPAEGTDRERKEESSHDRKSNQEGEG